jgi:hypothetical protein
MTMLDQLVSEAVGDFRKAAALAYAEIPADGFTIEILAKPHCAPRTLPAGHGAVYAFFQDGRALKVGMVGHKSVARYTSQHYNHASAPSNLAKSILTHAAKVGAFGITPISVGDWIKTNTDRVNILLPAASGLSMLSLLESFLHVRWKPLFEGRPSGD